ncbi:hypothetical protein NliqN6_0980 [Naganishia liquefaciens]|uniref:Sister chromatid cohesion protein DCC1 n=1 Tax=Naganishia liquefaciens TaxID=104408 RepID=A0A8H3YCV6_9TREE|nr:hypothetical protein NliqN6_0980 [Naganishia liquefaciens]
MHPYAIRYDPTADPTTGHTAALKLIQLTPDLARAIEQAERAGKPGVRLTIKGTRADDAVVCTDAQTYTLRTITVSNAMLCLRPREPRVRETTLGDLVLQDTCHEILELTPTAPRVARIDKLLKPSAWRGMGAGTGAGKQRREDEQGDERTGKRKRYTRDQLQSVVQASDAELEVGLRERNVITVDDHLLYLPTRPLTDLLTTLLSLFTIHASLPTNGTAPAEPILAALEQEYAVDREVTTEVMRLYGSLVGGDQWEPDVQAIVAQVGKGLLELESTIDPPTVDAFMDKWRTAIGTSYGDTISLKLLSGNHLLTPSPLPHHPTLITPFPLSHLPTDPAARFADLFLARTRWAPDEMEPFLKGLTPEGDRKAAERLVGKFVRSVRERDGVWWYARR